MTREHLHTPSKHPPKHPSSQVCEHPSNLDSKRLLTQGRQFGLGDTDLEDEYVESQVDVEYGCADSPGRNLPQFPLFNFFKPSKPGSLQQDEMNLL